MSIYDVFSGGNRPFDKEEWAAAKQAQRKEAYELIDNTCSEMVASGDSFRQYLDVQGRFDRYSVANAILVRLLMLLTNTGIHLQHPLTVLFKAYTG